MPYLFVGIIIASFASGYGFAYKVSRTEIREMSDSIDAMNREAEWTLAALTKEADKAHTEALKLNKELEDANVSAINAINSQHDSFKSVRMYDSRKSSNCSTTKDRDSSTVANTNADRYELSDELTSFLKSEAYRADQIASYAIMCQKFIYTLRN
jgi:cell division protein ZapA (FtsZ GTPase activity inhibitor)